MIPKLEHKYKMQRFNVKMSLPTYSIKSTGISFIGIVVSIILLIGTF